MEIEGKEKWMVGEGGRKEIMKIREEGFLLINENEKERKKLDKKEKKKVHNRSFYKERKKERKKESR